MSGSFKLIARVPAGACPTDDPSVTAVENVSGTPVFVQRDASMAAGDEFDDIVEWTPVHLLINRLLSAGLLP